MIRIFSFLNARRLLAVSKASKLFNQLAIDVIFARSAGSLSHGKVSLDASAVRILRKAVRDALVTPSVRRLVCDLSEGNIVDMAKLTRLISRMPQVDEVVVNFGANILNNRSRVTSPRLILKAVRRLLRTIMRDSGAAIIFSPEHGLLSMRDPLDVLQAELDQFTFEVRPRSAIEWACDISIGVSTAVLVTTILQHKLFARDLRPLVVLGIGSLLPFNLHQSYLSRVQFRSTEIETFAHALDDSLYAVPVMSSINSLHISSPIIPIPRPQKCTVITVNASSVVKCRFGRSDNLPTETWAAILPAFYFPNLREVIIGCDSIAIADLSLFLARHPGITSFSYRTQLKIQADAPPFPTSCLPSLQTLNANPKFLCWIFEKSPDAFPNLRTMIVRRPVDDRSPLEFIKPVLSFLVRRSAVPPLTLRFTFTRDSDDLVKLHKDLRDSASLLSGQCVQCVRHLKLAFSDQKTADYIAPFLLLFPSLEDEDVQY